METTRREFLGRSGLAVAGAGLLSREARLGANPLNQPLGFQAYEIIPFLEKDWEGTFRTMAGFGYSFIDLVITGPYAAPTAQSLRATLDDAGLTYTNAHFGYAALKNNFGPTVTYARALGVASLVCGPGPRRKTTDDWKWQAGELNAIGAMLENEGMFLGYHNHEIEFVPTPEGQVPYDILMAETDPRLVRFQIDVGNLTFGGADAITYLSKYPTRYYSLHAKDFQTGKAAVPVGSGELDWVRIFTLAKEANVRQIIAEVGAYAASTLQGQPLEPPDMDVLELYRLSADYLKAFKSVV